MKFSQFRDVVAVADCGSVRGAARRLKMAQPTITRSIREIEHELGIALFERHARGTIVTEMGQAFVRRAKAVIAEVGRAREEIEQLKGNATGEVHVAMSTAATVWLMPSAIVAFRRRYPNVLLRLFEHFFQPIEAEVRSGQIDFYVGPVKPESVSPDFAVEQLISNHRYVFARKGHPLAGATSLEELRGADWIRPTQSRNSTGDFAEEFLVLGLPPPHEVIHAHSIFITLLAMANTDLLTQLPRVWLDFPPAADYIAPLEGIGPLRAVPICIVRRRDMPLTPLAEYLCDLVRRAGEIRQYRERNS